MRDAGDDFTEQALRELENRLTMEYTKAEEEVRRKAMEFFEQYEKDYREWQAAVDRGEKTERQFRNWQQREMAQGARWNALKEQLSQDLYHTDQIARSITDGYMPDVYAINHNYGIYEIEVGNNVKTSLTLYNREAVERLMRDDPELLPPPGKAVSKKIAQGKAERWTRQKLQSIMTQGILQGESISRIATRLAKETGESNRKAAIRNARTMATNAENAGRYDAYRRADEMGIPLTIEWMATLDQRTRHDHRLLHGQRRNIDEPFEVSGVKILYPAQLRGEASDIPQHEIWNCRCTLLAWVKGFEGETVKKSRRMNGMSFEEWQQAKPVTRDITHTDRYTRDVPGAIPPAPPKVQPIAPTKPAKIPWTTKPPEPQKPTGVFAIKGISSEFASGMDNTLATKGTNVVREAFEKFGDRLICVDDKYKRTAHFSRYDEGCSFDATAVAKGNSFQRPYQTAFHEFGHNMDWLLGGGNVEAYASTNRSDSQGNGLSELLKQDFADIKKKYAVRRREEVVSPIEDSLKRKYGADYMYASGSLSDILEKFTGSSYPLGIGHGSAYHKRPGATEKEFFAEVIDAMAANPESYEVLKEYFPRGVQFVVDILKRSDLSWLN